MDDVPIRCECSARPLLAIARPIGKRWLLHIRVYRRQRLDAELLVEDGTVRIRCRACARWYLVRVRREAVSHHAEQLPAPYGQISGIKI